MESGLALCVSRGVAVAFAALALLGCGDPTERALDRLQNASAEIANCHREFPSMEDERRVLSEAGFSAAEIDDDQKGNHEFREERCKEQKREQYIALLECQKYGASKRQIQAATWLGFPTED